MTAIHDEIKAIDLCRQIDAVPTRWSISCIAEALMQEREAQRERDEKIAELAADDESDRQWNAATRYVMRRIRSQTP